MVNKEVDLELHLVFTVTSVDGQEAQEDCDYFLQWVNDRFTKWDDAILQHFLYEYNLTQDGNYTLDLHVDRVFDDGEGHEAPGQVDDGGASESKAATQGTQGTKPVKNEDIGEYDELAGSDFADLLQQAQDKAALNPDVPEGMPRPHTVDIPNPMEQVKRLLKDKRKKRQEND